MTDVHITGVSLYNFQSHNDKEPTYIPFIMGTNGLLGTSNSGKTSTIRAIKWCLLNTPGGTEFISVGTPNREANVKVWLSNGYMVERLRKKGGNNLYRLHKEGALIEEYTNFGSSVPPDILDAHGMEPIVDKVYSQFHDQLEGSFMLSLKPRKRAEILGDLDELKRVDDALSTINDDMRFHNKEKTEKNKAINDLKTQETELRNTIDRMKQKVERLKVLKFIVEDFSKDVKLLREKHDRLAENQGEIHNADEQKKKSERLILLYPNDIEDVIARYKKGMEIVTNLASDEQTLNNIHYLDRDTLNTLNEKKEAIEPYIQALTVLKPKRDRLKRIKEDEKSSLLKHSEYVVHFDIRELETLIDTFKSLSTVTKHIRQGEKDLKQISDDIQASKGHIDSLFDKFVSSLQEEGVCPTCGQATDNVSEHQLKHIN